jgi:hypothetical protein
VVRDLAIVDVGDEKPIGWAGLIVTDTVDVRYHAVAGFDERADRHLAAGEQADPHPFERLLATTAPGDPAVLVGETLPVQVVGQQQFSWCSAQPAGVASYPVSRILAAAP